MADWLPTPSQWFAIAAGFAVLVAVLAVLACLGLPDCTVLERRRRMVGRDTGRDTGRAPGTGGNARVAPTGRPSEPKRPRAVVVHHRRPSANGSAVPDRSGPPRQWTGSLPAMHDLRACGRSRVAPPQRPTRRQRMRAAQALMRVRGRSERLEAS